VEERTAQLQVANQELESFAYAVSHDLRAPLRAIHANAEILREDMEGRATPDDIVSLDRVAARAEEMSGLIDGLLKLSRIMRAELKREKIDLSATAHMIAEGLVRSAPDRKVDFVIQDGLTAVGDGALLSAALGNLLENAFKFTSKKDSATIEFGAIKERRKTTYFVRDNGAGFDPKHSSKLFGPFERLHAHGEFGGTGIGLATVQRIVRRHGGEIWAEGEVDKGATFYFTLPEQSSGRIFEGKSGAARQ
jgi:light-regulated signal transduction histidine kinase (bacteriophytochrome)